MSSLFCFVRLAFIVVALIAISKAENNNNKPIRSQQRHRNLASPTSIGGRGAPTNDRSSSMTSNGNKISSSSPAPLLTLKLAAQAVREEVTDIVESIVFAESNSERLENAFDAIKRHKLLLSASAVAIVLKSTLGGKG